MNLLLLVGWYRKHQPLLCPSKESETKVPHFLSLNSRFDIFRLSVAKPDYSESKIVLAMVFENLMPHSL